MTNNLLEGKKGIIFGALNDKSIAWHVAEKAHAQGARLVLTNAPVAMRMGTIGELAEKTGSEVFSADATSMKDLEGLFNKALSVFDGKIDFVLHSIGMSPNVRKGIPYAETSYENMLKTFDISALSFHRILQTAYRMDAINEWGSIVALSYVAAQRTLAGYNDMGDAKALLESIARSFGYIYGKEKTCKGEHRLPVSHFNYSRFRYLRVRRTGRLLRQDVAPWQCRCFRLCRCVHHTLL